MADLHPAVKALLPRLAANEHELTDVDLSGSSLGDADAAALAKALSNNTKLRRLDLSGNSIGNDGAGELAKLVQRNGMIHELPFLGDKSVDQELQQQINHCIERNLNNAVAQFGYDGTTLKYEAKVLLPRLAANDQGLTEVALLCIWLTNADAAALAWALRTNTTVKKLNLSFNEIGNEGAEELANLLTAYNNTLTTVLVYGNPIGKHGVSALKGALRHRPTLELKHLHPEVDALLPRLKKNEEGLTAVKLRRRDLMEDQLDLGAPQQWLTDADATALAKALRNNNQVKLLNLQGNKVGDEGAGELLELLEVNSRIWISLEGNWLDEQMQQRIKDLTWRAGSTPVSVLHPKVEALLPRLEANEKGLTEVNLSHEKLADADATALAKALDKNTQVVRLFLNDNNIGDQGAAALLQMLELNSTIYRFRLDANPVSEEMQTRLRNLTKHRLHAAVETLLPRLEANERGLTEIDLSGGDLGNADAVALAEALTAEHRELKEGAEVEADYRGKGSYLTAEVVKVESGASGRTYDLAYADGRSESNVPAQYVRGSNTQLKVLNLEENEIGDEGAGKLLQMLKRNGTILGVGLRQNKVSEGLQQEILDELLAKRNPKVKELLPRLKEDEAGLAEIDLSYEHLQDADAIFLCKALRDNTNVEVLNLSFNDIGDVGAGELAQLIEHNTTMREIYLSNNRIGGKGAARLADALRNAVNSRVTKLDLSSNQIQGEGATKLVEMSKSKDVKIRELELDSNQLGEELEQEIKSALKPRLMEHLLPRLQANEELEKGEEGLTVVNLYNKGLTDDDAAKIADALMNNTRVERLDLYGNDIGDPGATELAKMVQRNSTLTELDLGANNIDHDGMHAILHALENKKNEKSLRDLRLTRNPGYETHRHKRLLHAPAAWAPLDNLPSAHSLLTDLMHPRSKNGQARWIIILLCVVAVLLPPAISSSVSSVSKAAGNGSSFCNCSLIAENGTVASPPDSNITEDGDKPVWMHDSYGSVCSEMGPKDQIAEDFVGPVSGFWLVIVAAFFWSVGGSLGIVSKSNKVLSSHYSPEAKRAALKQYVSTHVDRFSDKGKQLVKRLADSTTISQEERDKFLNDKGVAKVEKAVIKHLLRERNELAESIDKQRDDAKEEANEHYDDSPLGEAEEEGKKRLNEVIEEQLQLLLLSKTDRGFWLVVQLLCVCFSLGDYLLWTPRPLKGGFLCTVAARSTLSIFYKPVLPAMWYGYNHLNDDKGQMLHHNVVTETVLFLVVLLFTMWGVLAVAVSLPILICFPYFGIVLFLPLMAYEWRNGELRTAQHESALKKQRRVLEKEKEYEDEQRAKAHEQRDEGAQVHKQQEGLDKQRAQEREEYVQRRLGKVDLLGRRWSTSFERLAKKRHTTVNQIKAEHQATVLLFFRLAGYTIIVALVFMVPLWPLYNGESYTALARKAGLALFKFGPADLFFDASFLRDLFRWPSTMDLAPQVSMAVSLGSLGLEQVLKIWRYQYFRWVGPSFHGRGGASASERAGASWKLAAAKLAVAKLADDDENQQPEPNGAAEAKPTPGGAAVASGDKDAIILKLKAELAALRQQKDSELAALRRQLQVAELAGGGRDGSSPGTGRARVGPGPPALPPLPRITAAGTGRQRHGGSRVAPLLFG